LAIKKRPDPQDQGFERHSGGVEPRYIFGIVNMRAVLFRVQDIRIRRQPSG
jgi:hypothetical protein